MWIILRYKLFGASKHRYKLNKPIRKDYVEIIEEKYNLQTKSSRKNTGRFSKGIKTELNKNIEIKRL